MILTDENDMYMYFEAAGQLEAERILDVGMFLKRAGCVSRQAMDRSVREDIRLDGIDLFPEVDFPVWHAMYSRRMSPEEFLEDGESMYDLAVILGAEAFYRHALSRRMMEKTAGCAKYALVRPYFGMWETICPKLKKTELQIEGRTYYLLDFGVR